MALPEPQLSGYKADIFEDSCVRDATIVDGMPLPALPPFPALPEPQRSENTAGIFEEGFIQLAPRTHDIALTESHSTIHKLGNDLHEAVQAAWSKRHEVRYSQVYVLLLSWVDDGLGVIREIKALRHVFKDMHNFQVQEYSIPSSKPDKALKRRVSDFLDIDAKDNLLIIYYGGHARRALQSNEASLWFA